MKNFFQAAVVGLVATVSASTAFGQDRYYEFREGCGDRGRDQCVDRDKDKPWTRRRQDFMGYGDYRPKRKYFKLFGQEFYVNKPPGYGMDPIPEEERRYGPPPSYRND